VRHARFGRGEVLSEGRGGDDTVLEIRFEDGSVRKLVERFVTSDDGTAP